MGAGVHGEAEPSPEDPPDSARHGEGCTSARGSNGSGCADAHRFERSKLPGMNAETKLATRENVSTASAPTAVMGAPTARSTTQASSTMHKNDSALR